MSNQFSQGPIVQGTTLGPIQPNQLVTGGSFQPSSQACVVDLTPPVFAGINDVTRGALGQLRAAWLAGSDASLPLRYEVYCKPSTASNLFQLVNLVGITGQLNFNIFALSDGTLLQNDVVYHVGVRAVDAVGNRDSNIVSISKTTPGISGVVAGQISGVFAINETNELIATFWANDADGIIDNPIRLGLASYQIYDEAGNLVAGMSESNISADAKGFFAITPVSSILDLTNTYYTVLVTIPIDGVSITYNLPITYSEALSQFEPRAVFSINAANELQGSIWITKNGQKLATNIGTASYSIRNKSGALIGISQTGISPDANGIYQTTPVLASSIADLNHYTVDIAITAEGVARSGVVAIVVGE